MLQSKVEAFLSKHSFKISGQSIAVGVSGGPDSLALLHYLWSIREKEQIKITAVHVDHMFRGQQSYEEAMFVKGFCNAREIPFEMKQINVPVYMKKTGKGTQEAARDCRYLFFEEVMKKMGCGYLALGHHGDDQIETIMMRLTRGSTGLARTGIQFSRPIDGGVLFRPLLCVSKEEIERYCDLNDLNPRRDPSNEQDTYSRNRFRHHVLPFLKQENPQVHQHFQRLSEDLTNDEIYLRELTVEAMNRVMVKKNGKVTIQIEEFFKMPIPLQRRGIKLILNYLYHENPAFLSAIHIDNIFDLLCNSHPSGTLDFPSGLKITRDYGRCHFQMKHRPLEPYCYEINKPGIITLSNGNSIKAEFIDLYSNWQTHLDSYAVNLTEIPLPLIIRTRKNGDRMTLKGMSGSKKIKDIFIDQKVPLPLREEWPIVTDGTGEILWIPGLKKAHGREADDSAGHKLLLTYIRTDNF
ncbi:tRNA lysidine(34) synthetase TilS [Mesobacillus harenae]|uniref:tRNA lysidine(34) synthetase TilS n=1 Tax=Mesobacillus harenae TaxID=2213203 RepID=UPI00157FF494|nr:tRNA lysidine(34) synthetase TilS [Mesobacillus harenae]